MFIKVEIRVFIDKYCIAQNNTLQDYKYISTAIASSHRIKNTAFLDTLAPMITQHWVQQVI